MVDSNTPIGTSRTSWRQRRRKLLAVVQFLHSNGVTTAAVVWIWCLCHPREFGADCVEGYAAGGHGFRLTIIPAPCKKGGPIHIAFPKVDGVRSFSSGYPVVALKGIICAYWSPSQSRRGRVVPAAGQHSSGSRSTAALPTLQSKHRAVKGGRVLNSGVCSFCARYPARWNRPAKSNDIKLPISFAKTGFSG
jgi:hypothetical protein